ncbi:MAG: SAM-dependent methyltransferase [Rhodospirillaceae bacterium]|nr:SAM-dependent methyltransferase [Rhodospirillaceae bacterium]MBT6118997.1 SAM-dependent methyltransferase [Rhodospirillaceae bacterium]
MSVRTIQLDDSVYDYMLRVGTREPDILRRLRAETAGLGKYAYMQISPELGQFLGLMVELTGARRVIEVGTFTGYSALAMALHLPADGRIVACDISKEWTEVGRPYWREAGADDRIDLRIGPGVETLDALIAEEGAGAYDLVFIDADKDRYIDYFEKALMLLRTGGLIAIDNVLWSGRVVDETDQEAGTVAIRAFNDHVAKDERVTLSLVPIGDGLTLARKR